MPRLPLHSRGEVIAALHAAAGVMARAALALGVTPAAIRARSLRDPAIGRAVLEARKAPRVLELCPACSGTGVADTGPVPVTSRPKPPPAAPAPDLPAEPYLAPQPLPKPAETILDPPSVPKVVFDYR